MNNLLRAETYKLKRNKTFWVLLITMIGLSSFLHYLIVSDWWFMSGTPFDQAGLSELNALSVFMTPLYFNFVVSTLAGYYISVEFSQTRVIKNQIISGNKRSHIFMSKYILFSLAAYIVTVFIPVLTALLMVLFIKGGTVITSKSLTYLFSSYGIFTIGFFCFTALVFIIAILTEDSGKTILFTFLISVVMFIIDLLATKPWIQAFYEHTFYFHFKAAFQHRLATGEIWTLIVIGFGSLLLMLLLGMYMFNKKEIKS